MSKLRPDLFDTDYDRLVTLGRSLIPKYAPDWTDHNVHDPGIMLLELMAWTAEAEIYSLGRMRRDERWAYGALLGYGRMGPQPARGLIWPVLPMTAPGMLAPAGSTVEMMQTGMPVFRLRRSLHLTAASLIGVESRLHDGMRLDHTAANAHPGASYFPFGPDAQLGDRLILSVAGPIRSPVIPSAAPGLLSIGVRVAPGANRLPCEANSTGDEAAKLRRAFPGRLSAALVDGLNRYPLRVCLDETGGFLHTGVILLDIDGLPERVGKEAKRYALEFASRGSGLLRPPQVLCMGLNVLPVEQSEIKETIAVFEGNDDLPDRRIRLEDTDLRTENARPLLTVTVDMTPWKFVEDLSKAGPGDAVFSFDHDTRQVRFGNGLNGRRVPNNAQVRVEYGVTEGSLGNLPPGLQWNVPGVRAPFGDNKDAMTGGTDERNLEELRRLARESARKTHSLVTRQDLQQAALALCDMQVARAEALPVSDRGRGCPSLPYLRTLVVLKARPAGATASESPHWLAEIQRLLEPRLLLGEKLQVLAPQYLRLVIWARLTALPGLDPAVLQDRASDRLAHFLALTTDDGGEPWPLGRGVQLLDVKAQLRNVEGVGGVTECTLEWRTLAGVVTTPIFSRRFLPLWDRDHSQIRVDRPAGGGQR